MRVAVVGGGAVGVTAAHDLAARGADVTLFEAGEIAGGSTGRAAGLLHDAFAAPEDAAVARRAIERFRELSGDGDFEFVETPYVWFAREGDETGANAVRGQVDRMREQGVDASLLDPAELGRRYPAVDVGDVGVAAIAPHAGRTDPASYARLMACEARTEGADLRTGVEAAVRTGPPRIRTAASEETFDAVLVAAGAHTKRLLSAAGVRIPLKPYRVQALTTRFDGDVPLLYDGTGGYYLRPHPTGLLAGDGTEEVESDPDDWDERADDAFRLTLLDRLSHRLEGFEADVRESWAGLCTATPDGDPLLGELRDGLYVATGWQGHGFMRAPATGESAARIVLGDADASPFDPTRFTGDERFEVVEGMALE